jgi:hypothetical protein
LGTKERRCEELVRLWGLDPRARQVEDGAGVDDEPGHRYLRSGVGVSRHYRPTQGRIGLSGSDEPTGSRSCGQLRMFETVAAWIAAKRVSFV